MRTYFDSDVDKNGYWWAEYFVISQVTPSETNPSALCPIDHMSINQSPGGVCHSRQSAHPTRQRCRITSIPSMRCAGAPRGWGVCPLESPCVAFLTSWTGVCSWGVSHYVLILSPDVASSVTRWRLVYSHVAVVITHSSLRRLYTMVGSSMWNCGVMSDLLVLCLLWNVFRVVCLNIWKLNNSFYDKL